MEKDLVKCEQSGMLKTDMGEVVEEVSETNYKFRFDKDVMAEIETWVQSSVEPQYMSKHILDLISSGERDDLSVSRPK